ncbi:MAG: substrate-binding domain-containing protein [Chitinophagaceae bacterium]|nr:substrate-binding domain-containing protein [Chitinophagaceae bacterium]
MNRIVFSSLVNKSMLFVACLPLFLIGCSGNKNAAAISDTLTTGTINISVDESFRPVIDSQIQVFESLHPEAKIVVHYKSEADCLRDLDVDSIRMVIVTRGLSDDEQKQLKDTLTYVPTFGVLAYDAIAAIVNPQTPDSLLTMQDIRSLAKGTSGLPYKIVMDGKNSTSTVRFIIDSLLKGEKMGANVEGAMGSEAVIDYISKNTNAVGLIGVSWIGNSDDPNQSSFLKKVNIASIECRNCSNGPYVKPYQANIYTGRYPMIRPLYYILKENYDGLGSGFRNFLIYEKGQKVFKRAYLLPARMALEVQNIDLSE